MLSRRCLAPFARWSGGLLLAFAPVFAGCNQLEPVETYQQITDPTQLYAQLALEHRAINLALVPPYDTIQLRAVPINARGGEMEGLPAPTFSLANINDTSMVSVTLDGLVQAKAPTPDDDFSLVRVVAELKIAGNIRHTDTAVVVIVPQPIPLSALLFNGAPPDSARQGMAVTLGQLRVDFGLFTDLFVRNIANSFSPTTPRALDAGGNRISNLIVEYASLDRTVTVPDDPFIRTKPEGNPFATGKPHLYAVRPGQVNVVARTTAFGVTWADTLPLRVTWPVVQNINVVAGTSGAPTFAPSDVRLGTSAIVFFQNELGDSIDVTFDDETNVDTPPAFVCDGMAMRSTVYGSGPYCGTGSMLLLPVLVDPEGATEPMATSQARQFMVAGVYHYHSVRTGATGRIVVTDDSDPTSLP